MAVSMAGRNAEDVALTTVYEGDRADPVLP